MRLPLLEIVEREVIFSEHALERIALRLPLDRVAWLWNQMKEHPLNVLTEPWKKRRRVRDGDTGRTLFLCMVPVPGASVSRRGLRKPG